MKMAGIVRRIDNLGRIVIPKEIRKTLRIQNGDNLEIFVDGNDNILLKKYSQINKLNDIAQNITEAMSNDYSVFITNNDEFIAGSGKLKRNYLNKKISNELLNILNNRNLVFKNSDKLKITNEEEFNGSYMISPIIAGGDTIGLVIVLGDNIDDKEVSIVKIITSFLAKHIEQ